MLGPLWGGTTMAMQWFGESLAGRHLYLNNRDATALGKERRMPELTQLGLTKSLSTASEQGVVCNACLLQQRAPAQWSIHVFLSLQKCHLSTSQYYSFSQPSPPSLAAPITFISWPCSQTSRLHLTCKRATHAQHSQGS